MNKTSVALKSYFPPFVIKQKSVDTSTGKSKKPALFLHCSYVVHLHSSTSYRTASEDPFNLGKLCSFPWPQFIALNQLKHFTNWTRVTKHYLARVKAVANQFQLLEKVIDKLFPLVNDTYIYIVTRTQTRHQNVESGPSFTE